MDSTTTVGTRLTIDRLTVRAAGRVLLSAAEAEFLPGQVTLIVGPSGAGKSILLRTLAGLLGREQGEISISGSVRFDDIETLGKRSRPPVGVVFQSFALFDELSPLENVRFAQAHRPRELTVAASDSAAALLDELHVPRNVRTASLSGGQRQRLAIARTLAYAPGVLLYDEPTSGLDAGTAEQVARLIRDTHAAHPSTSIIVTHDYASLIPIADVVYLLDTEKKCLVNVPRDAWPQLREMLRPQPAVIPPRGESSGDVGNAPAARSEEPWLKSVSRRWWRSAVQGARSFLEAAPGGSRDLTAILGFIPRWRSPLWGMRYFLHYLRLVAGPSAWLYIGLSGAIIGFVATYFTFQFFPFKAFTVPVLEEDLLQSLGFALYRILVPVMATILIAARCGAAVASDVGGKAYGQQLDALRTFNAPPPRYLLTGILYAFVIGTPLLVWMGYQVARLVSLMVFTGMYADRGPFYWDQNFQAALRQPGSMFYLGTGWLLAKVLICGVLIAWVAYFRGAIPKYSHRDVSTGITTTVLWATLLVLIVHFVFAFLEF